MCSFPPSDIPRCPPNGAPIDLIGSTTRPENTGIITANYNVGPWVFQWQQRFIDETMVRTTWVEDVDIDDNTIPGYFDRIGS